MKKRTYMPIYYDWLDTLKGNELLTYAYIMHRLEISKFVDECGITCAYISRKEIAEMIRIHPVRVSECVRDLKEKDLVDVQKDGRKWLFKGTKNVPKKVRKAYPKDTENVPKRYGKRTNPILIYKESNKESNKEFKKTHTSPSYNSELFKKKALGEIRYRRRG